MRRGSRRTTAPCNSCSCNHCEWASVSPSTFIIFCRQWSWRSPSFLLWFSLNSLSSWFRMSHHSIFIDSTTHSFIDNTTTIILILYMGRNANLHNIYLFHHAWYPLLAPSFTSLNTQIFPLFSSTYTILLAEIRCVYIHTYSVSVLLTTPSAPYCVVLSLPVSLSLCVCPC